MKYTGLVISDIHVGAMNLEKLHEEYTQIFINKIYKMERLDFVIVAGDFFDHRFYLNDRESSMAYIMLKELVNACKSQNAILRIVYGTESHECNQYDILSLLKLYNQIEVIKEVKEEELLPGLNILYIPEEHVLNKHDYYDQYLENYNKYDYIFGHGSVSTIVSAQIGHTLKNPDEGSGNKRKKVPTFNYDELTYACKGQIFFGHYHTNQNHDDKLFSIGSYSRWKFGESGDKGFYEIHCDTEKEKYNAIFHQNTLAETFEVVSYKSDNQVFQSTEKLEESLKRVEKLIESNCYNHVKFIFDIPNTIENPEATITYLKEKFKYNDKVKIEFSQGSLEEKRKAEKEQIDDDNKKYGFIFDNNIKLEEKISHFISIEYHKEIKPEVITDYLYKELEEILKK